MTFKGWNGVKDEKFENYGGSLKNWILKGGGYEKQIHRGKLLKKGGLVNLQILGGGRGDFEGVHIPMYTMHVLIFVLFQTNNCFFNVLSKSDNFTFQ